ncbi:hypothetical protein VTO42DRAFT_1867 [Malbranchea cinnamomea]
MQRSHQCCLSLRNDQPSGVTYQSLVHGPPSGSVAVSSVSRPQSISYFTFQLGTGGDKIGWRCTTISMCTTSSGVGASVSGILHTCRACENSQPNHKKSPRSSALAQSLVPLARKAPFPWKFLEGRAAHEKDSHSYYS